DQVVNKTERPCLRPIAKHSEILAAQRLSNKRRQYPAIVKAHTGSVSIEYSYNPRLQLMVGVVSHGDGLLETLRLVVHAAWTNRVYVTVVRFRLRMDERITIHLGGGRNEDARFFRTRKSKQIMCAQRSNLECLNRDLEVVDRTCRRSKMKDILQAAWYVDEL